MDDVVARGGGGWQGENRGLLLCIREPFSLLRRAFRDKKALSRLWGR